VLIAVFAASFESTAISQELVTGKVLQVARETVYIDLGRDHGVTVGLALRVLRDQKEIGRVQVLRIGDGFSACEVESSIGVFRKEDVVVATVNRVGLQELKVNLPAASRPVTPDRVAGSIEPDFRTPTNFRGKLALRHQFMDDKSASNRDVRQSSALVSLEARGIQGSPLTFVARFRARRYDGGRSSSRHPGIRLYDLALRMESQQYASAIGRLNPGQISGVGEFDGIYAARQMSPSVRVGLFGGFQPDFYASTFETRIRKGGAFVGFDWGQDSRVSQRLTIAFAGQYDRMAVGREFLYLQHTARWGRTVSLYQQAEVDLDRTGRSDRVSAVQLTNALVGLRYVPSRTWSMGAGYDARKYVPITMSDEPNLDQLIDESFRQGFRADVRVRPSRVVFLSLRGNLRLREGETSTKAVSTQLSVTRIPLVGCRAVGRFSYVTGASSESRGASVRLSRNLGRYLQAGSEWGVYDTKGTSSDFRQTRKRANLSLQIFLPGRWFATATHDRYTGGHRYSTSFFELGTRL
jgi:hypothetical protein